MAAETSRPRRILQPFRVGEFGLQSFMSGWMGQSASFMEETDVDPTEAILGVLLDEFGAAVLDEFGQPVLAITT